MICILLKHAFICFRFHKSFNPLIESSQIPGSCHLNQVQVWIRLLWSSFERTPPKVQLLHIWKPVNQKDMKSIIPHPSPQIQHKMVVHTKVNHCIYSHRNKWKTLKSTNRNVGSSLIRSQNKRILLQGSWLFPLWSALPSESCFHERQLMSTAEFYFWPAFYL